jgi:predicted metal-binding protein
MFRLVRSNWAATVLVCAKCSKKLDGGFGKRGQTPLHKALRKALGKGRKAGIGIVPVKCLGVCPRGAVTMVDSREPGAWRLVKAGTAVEAVVASLGER